MPRNRGQSGVSALFAIDKPVGLSSHDVVNRVRRVFNESRVGHTGTLDPLASGILIVGVGQAARLSDLITSHDKAYRARICFGEERTTDDAEGSVRRRSDVTDQHRTIAYAQKICDQFVGRISQVPPEFSAIHMDGARAYDLARSGKEVSLEPRDIEVYAAHVERVGETEGHGVFWDVLFSVSKGTYIRSLARDIGRASQSAAFLGSLRRVELGTLSEKQAVTLEMLEQSENPLCYALAVDDVLGLPAVVFSSPEESSAVINGNELPLFSCEKQVLLMYDNRVLAYAERSDRNTCSQASNRDNTQVSRGTFSEDRNWYKPVKVFPGGILTTQLHGNSTMDENSDRKLELTDNKSSSDDAHLPPEVELSSKQLITEAAQTWIPEYHGVVRTVRVSPVSTFKTVQAITDNSPFEPHVCCLGAFDGVHKGHLYLIAEMIRSAKKKKRPCAIITFDCDPDEFFKDPSCVKKLSSNSDRIDRLTRLGADKVIVLPFVKELASLTYLEFLEIITQHLFPLDELHVGSDFKVGSSQEGTVERLREWGLLHGCTVFGSDLLQGDQETISSTRIRSLIHQGQAAQAAEFLGRPYFVAGTVVTGRQAGRSFGIPTANIELSYPYQLPGDGVYAGIVRLNDTVYPAAINVGVPQTFKSEANCGYIEAYLIGFSGDVYGHDISVSFAQKLRDQRVFSSQEELISVVSENINQVIDRYGRNACVLKGL